MPTDASADARLRQRQVQFERLSIHVVEAGPPDKSAVLPLGFVSFSSTGRIDGLRWRPPCRAAMTSEVMALRRPDGYRCSHVWVPAPAAPALEAEVRRRRAPPRMAQGAPPEPAGSRAQDGRVGPAREAGGERAGAAEPPHGGPAGRRARHAAPGAEQAPVGCRLRPGVSRARSGDAGDDRGAPRGSPASSAAAPGTAACCSSSSIRTTWEPRWSTGRKWPATSSGTCTTRSRRCRGCGDP